MAEAHGTSPPLFGAVVRPLQEFFRLEALSGAVLFLSGVTAFVWANVDLASYRGVFGYSLAFGAGNFQLGFTLRALINDGLMTIFFFVVGMEIKREFAVGELRTGSHALLPAIAALGGVAVPAAIFLAFTWGTPAQVGWAIPMATDIAFCIALLGLLQTRIPRGLVVFAIALATFDDIAGVLVIAAFYSHGIQLSWLLAAGGVILVLLVMHRRYVVNPAAYALVGVGLWYVVVHAGIHATIAGVVLGLAVPARSRRRPRDVLRELGTYVTGLERKTGDDELDTAELMMIEEKLEDLQPPLDRFMAALHPFVAFIVMPVFALANSGVSIRGATPSLLLGPVVLGTALGLFIGKQAGVFGTTWLAKRVGIAPLPGGASVRKLWGVSIITGMGLTVALFIATLAYANAPELLEEAKLGILIGSIASGVTGYLIVRSTPAATATQGANVQES